MSICYQTGKGNHLVPVLFPSDCRKAIDCLTDLDIRSRCGVHPSNGYIFANTELSENHVSGWDCTNKMCMHANVPEPTLITASKQRHRISTFYAALDVPDISRQAFYSHMGHNERTNRGTYQYPLPILEITQVGKHLHQFDKGKVPNFSSYPKFPLNRRTSFLGSR